MKLRNGTRELNKQHLLINTIQSELSSVLSKHSSDKTTKDSVSNKTISIISTPVDTPIVNNSIPIDLKTIENPNNNLQHSKESSQPSVSLSLNSSLSTVETLWENQMRTLNEIRFVEYYNYEQLGNDFLAMNRPQRQLKLNLKNNTLHKETLDTLLKGQDVDAIWQYCKRFGNKKICYNKIEKRYNQRNEFIHIYPKNYLDIAKNVLLELNISTSYNEGDLLCGQISSIYKNKPETSLWKVYYSTQNPLQYYDNKSTIKYISSYRKGISTIKDDISYHEVINIYPVNIRFTFLHFPVFNQLSDLFDNYDVVIFVKTGYVYQDRRDLIRKTWKSIHVNDNFKYIVYFVSGVKENATKKEEEIFNNELQSHNDIIVANIVDNYQNNTLKTFMIEDLFLMSKSNTQFIMITDDDICLNVYFLYSILEKKPKTNLYLGRKFVSYPDKSLVFKHSTPAFCIPYFIPFADGPGMLFSKDVINKHMHILPYLDCYTHTDDVMLSFLSMLSSTPLSHRGIRESYTNILRENDVTLINRTDLFIHKPTTMEAKKYCH
ncbi:hypothetical protein WA158_006805 [Blastocystis sp. Blastoise]